MPKTIAFLIFDRFQLLDTAGPLATFEMPTRAITPPPYRLRVIAAEAGPVHSSSGIAVHAEALTDIGEAAGAIDTLIISGGQGSQAAAECPLTLAFIRQQALHARRVCSVCSGAYLLAAAGLLDGRRATTHWGRSQHFAKAYPRIRLEPDRIFVRDGSIWTAAGVTAGIDLALALIGEDLGEPVAKRAAQELVVSHRRSGGQSQFSALLDIEPADARFSDLMAWIREHLAEPLPVERLAEQAHMSSRNFARAFTQETGVTPAKAVERLRLEAARARIESGTEAIESIAAATGFGDAERMRRSFLRTLGQPPQALRRSVRAQP